MLAVGASGAGKTLRTDLLASELLGSASAYQVGGTHRHNPEIVQNLEAAGGAGVTISFTPVLVPISRGILATSTAKLEPGVSVRRRARGLGVGLRRRAVRARATRRAASRTPPTPSAPTPR